MKHITLFLVFLINSLLLFAQTPSNDPHWNLLWQDDFNFFDSNKWMKGNYAQHGEPQIYMDSHVYTTSGNLVIKIDADSTYCYEGSPSTWGAVWPCEDNTWYNYTSGWVESREEYNAHYGYIEARINTPYGYGFWPAFWTFVGQGNFTPTNASEIDIFEMLGHLPSSVLTTNVHHAYCGSNRPDYDSITGSCSQLPSDYLESSPTGFSWNSTWHTYGVEWSPSKIIWYLDNIPIRTYLQTGQTDPATGQPMFPVDPGRIILNLAITPNHLPNSSTPFPSYMYVDYVKVYNLANDCNTDVLLCNYNFSNHVSEVKKTITIGTAGGCNNSLSTGDNIHMRASDGIIINGEFTVPLGSELYLDVNSCY